VLAFAPPRASSAARRPPIAMLAACRLLAARRPSRLGTSRHVSARRGRVLVSL
jgi:hypothetical protein